MNGVMIELNVDRFKVTGDMSGYSLKEHENMKEFLMLMFMKAKYSVDWNMDALDKVWTRQDRYAREHKN